MDRIAIVTGASRGIGLEVASQLLRKGVHVILGVRTPTDTVRKVIAGFESKAEVHPLDVTSPATIQALLEHVQAAHGRLDILVNNAGVHYDTDQRAATADLNVVSEALDVNLIGPWRMTKAFAPLMGRSGHAVIVNVSSGGGALNSIGASTPAYSVSKAALNALTISLAADLKRKHVLVNAVCPGWVATDMGGLGGRPVSEGAKGVVWAALLPADGPTGGFFRDAKQLSWLEG